MNLLCKLSFQARLNDVLVRRKLFRVIDVPADAERALAVQPTLGLAIGSAHQQVAMLVADGDIGNDLLEPIVLFDERAAAKRMMGENVVQAPVKVRSREHPGEQRGDAEGWDDEDVFVHAPDASDRPMLRPLVCLLCPPRATPLPAAPETMFESSRSGVFWKPRFGIPRTHTIEGQGSRNEGERDVELAERRD